MNRTLLLSSAALCAISISSTALAADLPETIIPETIIPDVSAHNWGGIYLGVHLGIGGLITDGTFEASDESTSDAVNNGALSNMGPLVGAQVGWNFQNGNAVFGVEGDISLFDIDKTREDQSNSTGAEYDNDYLATIRGRVGWADDDTLIYMTGGVAFMGGTYTHESDSISVDAVGGVVGMGIEWAATSRTSVKVEGLYLFFDDSTSLATLPDADSGDFFEFEDAVVARVGVNHQFYGNAGNGNSSSGHSSDSDYSWAGPYVGGFIGAGAFMTDGVFEGSTTSSSSEVDLGALSDTAFLGGAQVGWNFQNENGVVYGIEGDIAWLGWDNSALNSVQGPGASFDADYLATIRGRVGWADGNTLLYVTGGVAFLDGTFRNDDEGDTIDISAVGGVLGTGIEWGATQNLSVKVEALGLFFDDSTDLSSIGEPGDNLVIDDAVIARVGVNYRIPVR